MLKVKGEKFGETGKKKGKDRRNTKEISKQ